MSLRWKPLKQKMRRTSPLQFFTCFATRAERLSSLDLRATDQGNKCVWVWVCVWCLRVHAYVLKHMCAECVWERLGECSNEDYSPVMRKGCTRLPHTALVAHKHWAHRRTWLRRLQEWQGWDRDTKRGWKKHETLLMWGLRVSTRQHSRAWREGEMV